MENTLSTMVLHKHVDGEDTRYATISGTLVNNPLGKCLGVIIRGTYPEEAENSWWECEPVSGMWPDIYPYSDSTMDFFCDEGIKYLENLNNQEHQKVLSDPHMNSRKLRQCYQR